MIFLPIVIIKEIKKLNIRYYLLKLFFAKFTFEKIMEKTIKDLEDTVDELADRLAKNFFQTTQVLSSLLSFTERYYEGSHSRFVAEKSAHLARELDLSEEDVMETRIAGMLHDIGKIGFSDSTLYKYPSEMTPSEYKQYTLHPKVGQMLLLPHEDFKKIGEIILQTHEKLDGSGFPRHLTKDEINPSAKIIIVVDYFHNAVYKRIRKESSSVNIYTTSSQFLELTKERYNSAMNYLHKKSGVLFEKKVVELLTNTMELERKDLGLKSVMRVPVNKVEPGMVFAEDYFTSYGMLIAAKGETLTKDMMGALVRFAENGEIPHKILVIR